MNYLILHTRSTGKPQKWDVPVTETWNWPRLIELAWGLADKNGQLKKNNSVLIRPQGFEIAEDILKEHKLTNTQLLHEGISCANTLQLLQADLEKADLIVAHNLGLHEKIIGAECVRLGIPDILAGKKKVCTMISGTAFCKIPGTYGNKWPSRDELYLKLFGKAAPGNVPEVELVAACFWGLKNKGQIK